MNKIYIVIYNDIVSSEGYLKEDNAINFIESRTNSPQRMTPFGWLWKDENGDEYKIKEIIIK